MRVSISRQSYAAGAILLSLLLLSPRTGLAGDDSGLRLEAGTDFSLTRYTDSSEQYASAAVVGNFDAWTGPFGMMVHARKGTSINQILLTDQGLVPVLTWSTRLSAGPLFHVKRGPLRFTLGVGPYFERSVEQDEAAGDISMSNFWTDFSNMQFMGLATEARLDVRFPILSPFGVITVNSQRVVPLLDETASAGDYEGREVRALLGVRLNLIPFLKLSAAGFAGQSQYVVSSQEIGTGGTTHLLSESYGASIWATLLL